MWRAAIDRSAPAAAPGQFVPLMMMSIRASVARGDQFIDRGVDRAVLAADPIPVTNRERKKNHGANANAFAILAARYTPRVIMNSRLRPNRSVSWPLRRDGARDRADDRNLEPVEDPHSPEPDEDLPVPARPRQPVKPRRDVRLDRRQLAALSRRRHLPTRGLDYRPILQRRARTAAIRPGARGGARIPPWCLTHVLDGKRVIVVWDSQR